MSPHLKSIVYYGNQSYFWSHISAGHEHSCGLSEGRAICWPDTPLFNPTKVLPPTDEDGTPYTDWIQVSAGRDHSCGIRQGGRLYCWGSNGAQQRELPQEDDFPQFNWIGVQAGGYHTCALHQTGVLWCWGRSEQAQLDVPQNVLGSTLSLAGDNCPEIWNPGQEDLDGDGVGDACDLEED